MPKKATAPEPSARDRAREARNDVYRAHILASAEAVFADSGFEAAKLQDISKRAALSMGTIYAIFPGKVELLAAILELRGGEMLAVAREICGRGEPAMITLEALIDGYIGYFAEHPAFLRMHLREGGSWVLTPGDGVSGRAQIWKEIHATQTELFRRGIKAGVFVSEDPEFLAKIFSALDQVLLADWVASGMKQSPADLGKRLRALAVRTFGK